MLGDLWTGTSRVRSAVPHASNHGLSGSTTNSVAGSFARSAATMAALRVTPPISSTRRSSRWPFSSRATTLLAMLSCSVCRMSSGVASLRLSLWVMSDLQCTEQRDASGTTFPANERWIASSISRPIRPICWTKNSPLPAAHLLCEKTLTIRRSATM
jgi:hypothetical protein